MLSMSPVKPPKEDSMPQMETMISEGTPYSVSTSRSSAACAMRRAAPASMRSRVTTLRRYFATVSFSSGWSPDVAATTASGSGSRFANAAAMVASDTPRAAHSTRTPSSHCRKSRSLGVSSFAVSFGWLPAVGGGSPSKSAAAAPDVGAGASAACATREELPWTPGAVATGARYGAHRVATPRVAPSKPVPTWRADVAEVDPASSPLAPRTLTRFLRLLCCGERCFAPPPRGRAVRDVDDRSAAATTIFGLKHTPPKKGVLITRHPHYCTSAGLLARARGGRAAIT
mmetsp:Transcript_25141/g.62964  ORF Transcript_25141/g.62964 Transcript_25141/m.62964 type:complete len:286 (+) Transcript_25141:876-1733(+)